jgi:hypothetical protein
MLIVVVVVVVRHGGAEWPMAGRFPSDGSGDRRDASRRGEPAMDEPHLIYFADPMCSWCYGFSGD